ncbi:hypothetical protein GCM10027289_18000 [Tsukamurella serpentis]
MTQPNIPNSRKRAPRRSSGGAGQWMLGAVIVLAVIGTGMWVFSDDRRWGLVALILLVWGLVIAAFLIARYTRDLRAAESKESGLKTVYELQLEREISARREYELQVEREIRAEVRDEANEELTALKSEVLALRANLEELLGRDLGPSYQELYAAAEQRALAAQRSKSVFEDDDRFRAQQDFAGVPDQVADVDDYYGAASAAPSASGPQEPGNAQTGRPGQPGFNNSQGSGFTVPSAPGAGQDPGAAPRRESPTMVFEVVPDDVDEAASSGAGARESQPVDVEHVEHIDPTTAEPFVPMAPQSGYRPPFPPRPYTPTSGPQPGQQPGPQPGPQQGPGAPAAHGFAAPPAQPSFQPQQSAPSQPEAPQDQGTSKEQSEHTGQHTSGSTVADLIARMNADTERSQGGRRRKPE